MTATLCALRLALVVDADDVTETVFAATAHFPVLAALAGAARLFDLVIMLLFTPVGDSIQP